MKKRATGISSEKRQAADIQLKEMQKQIDYDTKDFTVELIVSKFERKEFFVPEYQREFVWRPKNKTSFIESVLLGLPIPFMFFGDCDNGKMEIIDGAQRVQTLAAFVNNKLKLDDLPKLTTLKGFRFSDLSDTQGRKFLNRTLRVIILDETTPQEVRQDIFNRINTSGVKANESEIRRGSYPGKLTNFIDKCATDALFVKLCPVTDIQRNRHERFELLLRFFAYANKYEEFDHRVADFLDEFIVEKQKNFDEGAYQREFTDVLKFVHKNFPFGFAKTKTATTTPRVRFEAISVGVALALRINPELNITNVNWLNSAEFKKLTTSDASNNQGKLKQRVEYVRNQLLKEKSHE